MSDVKVFELLNALREWAKTYPDLGDAHDEHRRGRFLTSTCSACRAEAALLDMADEIDYAMAKQLTVIP